MSASSRSPDRFATTFDHEGLVANAGLILAGTLMARLGLSALIERWVRTGSANPGPKICTVVAAMLAGATHIDHVGMLRAGRTGRVLGFRPVAPSTVGTLRRTFTFGHVRQLEAVLSRTLARAWGLGAGPGEAPLVVDPGSTICEVHGKQKQGAAYGLHQSARLSPAARCTRRHRRGARRPHAQRLRGVLARRGALRRRARREPATRRGCGADHGARRLGILVMEADRPSRRPRLQVVDHRRPHTRCSRSDPSDRRHRVGRHRLHQRRPRPGRRNPIRHRPRQSQAHRSSRGAPHPPRRPRSRARQPIRHTHPAIPRPLALANTIPSHTQRPASSARTLRLTRTPRNWRPHTNPASTPPNHTRTPSPTRPTRPTRPNTPNQGDSHPQQPGATPTRHRPAKPALAKGQSVDSGLVVVCGE